MIATAKEGYLSADDTEGAVVVEGDYRALQGTEEVGCRRGSLGNSTC